MRLADLSEKLVIILGFGREGKATYDVLKSKVPTARIIVTDEQEIDVPEYHQLIDAIAAVTPETVVIKSPGIPWHRAYVEEMENAGVHFTSSTNLFMAERRHLPLLTKALDEPELGEESGAGGRFEGLIIGITGTKGKSTTSSLLAHVLKAAGKPVVLAGNIGEPAILHVSDPAETIFVLEMSSYQLSDLVIAPDISVILNLYEEHMDYHGDVESYHAAKMRIADLQTANDVFIYNEKFPKLVDLANRVRSNAIPFVDRLDPSLNSLALLGDHNRENAAGVLAVTDYLRIDRAVVNSAFASFKSLPHRLQDVGTVQGIQFVNDSFCTTPAAALAAIEVFQDRLGAIILGGHDRGYDFTDLAKRVVNLGVRIYLLQNATRLEVAIRSIGGAPIMISTFPEIVRDVIDHCELASVCLLSPASPSFGQFTNFVERGEQFVAAVEGAK
ncbi:MAG: UDP-N-acetylmuramoyl-L-alanine--D-glutamate ligase [Patescibacteria group bacterium]